MTQDSTISVLHVDDDPSQLQIAKLILERTDPTLHVETAEDPLEALSRITRGQFDCIVTDYRMPDLNGIELATKIRQHTDAPIILYTGQGSEKLAEEAFAVGVDDYIRKEPEPSHYQILAKRIRTAVDKHRAESHLQESEENYRSVVEHANQGIIVIQDGLLRFVNPRVAEMTGYTPEELLEKPFIDYLHPEDRHEALETYRNRATSETTFYPFRIITKDGDVLWIEVNGIGIDWNGSLATLHFLTDITERKRARAEISQREERYRALFETSPFAISIHDINSVITSINPAFTKMTGFAEEELKGKTLSAIAIQRNVGQEKTDFIAKILRALLSDGELPSFEYPFKRKDGAERWCMVSASLLYMDGKKTGIQLLAHDITDQKTMREELQRSEEDYKRLIESAPDAIVTADLRGYITSVNQKVIESTGLSREELIGKHVSKLDFVLPEYRSMLGNMIGPVLRGKLPKPFKVRICRGDGSHSLGEVRLSLIKKKGKAVGIQTITRDITERQRLEDERILYQERMEALHRHTLGLGEARNLQEVAKRTLATIEKVMGFDLGGFAVVDGDVLRMIFAMGFDVETGYEWPLDGPGITVRTVITGESQLVPDIRLDEDYDPGPSSNFKEVLSELVVPIKSEGEVIGLINVESYLLNAFTEQDKKLIETLSQNVGLTLSRLRHLELLQASEERYKTFLDSSRDAVFVLDDTQYLYVNKSGASLLGYDDPEELIGVPPFNHISPKDREMVENIALRRRRGEEAPNRYNFRLIREDGTEIDVETNVSLINYEGRPASLALNRDVTEQMRIEAELKTANLALGERVKEITCLYKAIRAMQEAESIEELGPRVVELMASAMQFPESAVSELELVGRVFSNGRRSEDLTHGIHTQIINRGEVSGKLSIYYPEGLTFTVEEEDMLHALADSIGGWYDGIQAAKTLLEHTNRLEGLVEEKTQELLDAERLVTAGRIAATVGHDLRGPLQTIKNAIYLMRQSPESVDEMIDMVNKSVDRASEMIDMFRSQTRDSPLMLGDVNLVEMVGKAVEEAALPRSIEAILELDESLESVYLDGTKIHRVLDNLIQNAVEAMPTGGKLTVSAKRERGKITITVSDTGIGIPEDEAQYIFKPFHTTKEGGLGLGLYYCKRTIEAHEGTIEQDSEVGAGTTFTIEMPVFTQDNLSHFEAQAIRSTLQGTSPTL